MRQLYLILTFFIFSVCNAQTKEKLVSYLKYAFPKKDSIYVGSGTFYEEKYYDFDNLPVESSDLRLKKSLPKFKFYTFSILYKGCYTFDRHPSILIYDIKADKFYTVASLNFEISKEVLSIIGSYKAKNKQELDEYLSSISSILFSTLYVGEIKKLNSSENEYIFYDTKNGKSLTFEIEKNQVQNIKFKL